MAVQNRCRRPWLWRGIAALVAHLPARCRWRRALPHAQAEKSAVLVIDANTGRVLHQSAADELRHPASLAKMMTLYIAFELIEQGRLSYQTKIKISANAAAATPSKLDLDEGEEIALIDAIKALITKSANDVAVADCRAHRRQRGEVRQAHDPEGAPARHARHDLPQRLGPAR